MTETPDGKLVFINKYAQYKMDKFDVDIFDFIRARETQKIREGKAKFRAILSRGSHKIIFIFIEFEDRIYLKTVTETRKRGEKYG